MHTRSRTHRTIAALALATGRAGRLGGGNAGNAAAAGASALATAPAATAPGVFAPAPWPAPGSNPETMAPAQPTSGFLA